MNRPEISSVVTYVTAQSHGLDRRKAIVVGYPDGDEHTSEVHLAVLTDDAEHLDLLALTVQYSAHPRAGHWMHAQVGEWPSTSGDLPTEQPGDDETDPEDTQVMEAAGG